MSSAPRTPAARARGVNVPVRMSEIAVSNDPASTLSVIGLGSCVALTIVVPEQRMAGVAHVVLPDSAMARGHHAPPGKFADTAVPALVENLGRRGADVLLMRAVLVGGSAMFGTRKTSRLTAIGEQNIEALTAALGEVGIRIAACDLGGPEGRTVHVPVGDCRVLARTITGEERELFPAEMQDPPITRFLAA